MERKFLLAILALFYITPVLSCDIHGVTGIVEENSLYIPVGVKNDGGISEDQFNEAIERISAIYDPIIEEMGGKLVVERKWDDGTVNAYAQRLGTNWQVSMFGGLARHEAITQDAFSVVVCHEIGHHIGGAPKKSGWFGSASWASNEGQADYFGTMKCLRKYMEKDNNQLIVKGLEVPALVTKQCSKNFNTPEEVAMCQRGAMAGLSLANLFRSLRSMDEDLKFDTPDPRIVTKTNHGHPAPQCRLDTYFQGALCESNANDDVDQEDPVVGTCSRELGFDSGIRPLCWYHP